MYDDAHAAKKVDGVEAGVGIESPYALLNGKRSPEPLHLTVGETH